MAAGGNDVLAVLSDDEIHLRRIEEVEALLSYYGEDDFKQSLNEFNSSSQSSSSTNNDDDEYDEFSSLSTTTTKTTKRLPSLDGPWFLRLHLYDTNNCIENNNNNNSTNYYYYNYIAILELRIPPHSDYPIGSTSPTPILHIQKHVQNINNNNNSVAVASSIIDSNSKRQFLQRLQEEYMEGTCVGIYWGECCRAYLLEIISTASSSSRQIELKCKRGNCGDGGDMPSSVSVDASSSSSVDDIDNKNKNREKTITFLPSSTRFHQPVRHFPSSIVTNPRYQCTIHRTPPFHPPNSGASECFIAHVAKVSCMEQVLWTLGQLLLHDKKVSKASHNMFAYRFYTTSSSSSSSSNHDDDGSQGTTDIGGLGGGGGGGGAGRSNGVGGVVLTSDNDDDGEKGSGKKLSALLELCHAENVLVVVSRWFGGELLGAARFKWIASVAKDGLVQAGIVV